MIMHPAYFETHFRPETAGLVWPAEFAIITAFATTGETWTPAQNNAADRLLAAELRGGGRWLERLTGYSPVTGHAEDGWAVEMPLAEACETGRRFKQDAIYYVINDSLHVTYCDRPRRELVAVGPFRERVGLVDANQGRQPGSVKLPSAGPGGL